MEIVQNRRRYDKADIYRAEINHVTTEKQKLGILEHFLMTTYSCVSLTHLLIDYLVFLLVIGQGARQPLEMDTKISAFFLNTNV